ncbi:MAG: glycosyltransferase [Pseudomonadota bacterium]
MFSYFDAGRLKRSRRSVFMITQSGVLGDPRVLKSAQSVRKLGYRVTLFGVHAKRHVNTLEYSTFTITLLPDPIIRLKDKGEWSKDPSEQEFGAYDRIAADQLAPYLRSAPPDILHTYDKTALAVGSALFEDGWLEQTTWIHDLHADVRELTERSETKRRHYVDVERKAIALPNRLTTVSLPKARQLCRDYDLSVEPTVIYDAPRLADFDKHHQRDIRTSLGVASRMPLLVYYGNLEDTCDVDRVIDALPERQDYHLALLTNAYRPAVDAVHEYAKRRKVQRRVHVHAPLLFANMTSFLRTASVGVMTSRSDLDVDLALPAEVFDTIHAGLPIVASNQRTVSHFIQQEQCGTTFDLDDPTTLLSAVDRALEQADQPGMCDRLSEIAARYAWEEQERTIASVYESVDPIVLAPVAGRSEAGADSDVSASVLHLPIPQAGQAAALANGLRAEGVAATSMSVRPNAFGYRCDINLDRDYPSAAKDGSLVRELARDYDVFHFHARSLFYRRHHPFGSGLDLVMLRLFGRRVFYHFRGTEIRMASVFEQHSPYAYVSDNPDGIFSDNTEAKQRAYRAFVEAVCHAVFVTDPELQTYVPDAIIVPRALNVEDWPELGCARHERLKVVHVPSSRSTKGTNDVLTAIERLRGEGHQFDFQLVEGVSHDQAKAIYRDADIVIDQLRIGWYGVLAVEAMALGKAVIAYVRDDLRHYLPSPCPLKIANPENVHQVLGGLLKDRTEVVRLGKLGRTYVEEVHDARRIAAFLKDIYASADEPVGDPMAIHAFFNMQLQEGSAGRSGYGRSAVEALTRVRRWARHFRPNQHLGMFVDTWRRDGADQAIKRTLAFLRER